MPCRDDCRVCGKESCTCPDASFDYEGALCDVLSMIEAENPSLLGKVDLDVLVRWRSHTKEESEKIKAQALAKLTPREIRVLRDLGFK